MHTFQPISIEDLDVNFFKMIGKDWMLVTAEKDGKVNTMTASWGGIGVLWGKNVTYVFIRESRYTREYVDASDTFSLSFFGGNNKREMKYLGAVSGRDEDKISNARFNVNYHDQTPLIDEANMVLVCKKLAAQPISKDFFLDMDIDEVWYKDHDYHIMYVGEITDILAR